MNYDTFDNSSEFSFSRSKISEEKLLMGSIADKYPVILKDGRTTVYISDKTREAEIRLKYETLKDKKYPSRSPRHH